MDALIAQTNRGMPVKDKPGTSLMVNFTDNNSFLGSGYFGTTWIGQLHGADGPIEVAARFPRHLSDTYNLYLEMAKIVELAAKVPHPNLVQVLAYEPTRRSGSSRELPVTTFIAK
eukprot:2737331-Amphidinium_carterae.1